MSKIRAMQRVVADYEIEPKNGRTTQDVVTALQNGFAKLSAKNVKMLDEHGLPHGEVIAEVKTIVLNSSNTKWLQV